MSASGASNPEYVNARVRARRAKLFDDDEYRDLVKMGPGGIARRMEETEYEAEINELGARHGGVDLIEYALNRNLAKHFDDLLRFADGRLYDLVARYLRKFDAWNVKTVLRGIYSGAEREEIESDLIRAGEFDDRLIGRMLDATSVEDLVEVLEGTVFGPGLAEALGEYEGYNSLVPLENAVDRAFYENLLGDLEGDDEATKLYVEFLQAEIDFRNVRNALRLARSGADIDPAEYYIDGGRLFTPTELSSIRDNADELVARVRESPYGDDLEEALDDLAAAESLIGFENAIEAALLEYSDRLSNLYPLSICPVLAYVLAKEREVKNVRAIARAKEAGLPPEEIESELVTI
ncbi:V-type ATP synthase subunit C [Halobacteriales archaeon QS_8_69_26]|nr:MAG: V-type ATP synthase subunit C [Halobacteriales archaeon QS_8_69_26]